MTFFIRQSTAYLSITIFIFSLFNLSTPMIVGAKNTVPLEDLNFVPGQVLVKYKNQAKSSSKDQKIGAQTNSVRELPFTKIDIPLSKKDETKVSAAALKSAKQETLDYITKLKKDPNVEYAEPNYIVQASGFESNDPLYTQGSLWGLNNQGQFGMTADIDINAPEGWTKNINNGENIKIAILDSGVDYNHEDLRDNIDLKDPAGSLVVGNINGYNFCTGQNCEQGNSEDPIDNYGHGTSVAGIAAAVGQNSIGGVGVCPKCKIMPVKVLDQNGFGDLFAVTMGIYYAIDNGARVINLSLAAGGITSEYTSKAIAEAVSKNIIVTSVAGNCGDSSFSTAICQYQNQAVYPAVDPNVLAVGSLDPYGNKSSFSNTNEYVFLAAPGEGIDTTCLGGGYCRMTGTSASSPFVAGSVGLFLSQNPNLNFYSIKNILQSTAKDVGAAGYDAATGFGMPNIQTAMDNYSQYCGEPGVDRLCVEYYNNPNFAGLPTIRTYENGPSLERKWAETKPEFLFQNNNYSIRYTGAFEFENAAYTIKTQGGAGKFYLDDMQNPIVNYAGSGQNINQNTFNISAGRHTFKFEFSQNDVVANNILEIKKQEKIEFTPFPLDKYLGVINEGVKVVEGDYNGDGKTDLIKQEKTTNGNQWMARIYLSNGDGTFAAPVNITDMKAFDGRRVDIIPGDFNGDGKTDIIRQERNVWIDGFRDTEIYLSNGDGTFAAPVNITDMKAFDGRRVDIIPGDFNGDKKTDIIRQERNVWIDGFRDTEIYLSNGDGTFAAPVNITDMKAFDGRRVDIIPGDFNGDGKTDVVRWERRGALDGIRDIELYVSNQTST
jgi:subtilisin family serine protease